MMVMWQLVHQHAYFFSLVLFILPVSIAFDATIGFRVIRKLATPKAALAILGTVILLSLFDVFWLRGLGYFPSERVMFSIAGIPLEEMLLFAVGFYNLGAIFAWAKAKFP